MHVRFGEEKRVGASYSIPDAQGIHVPDSYNGLGHQKGFVLETFQHAGYQILRQGAQMRNPEYTGHFIRKLLDTQSGFHWTLNPEMTGQ